jgi:LAO/AO transport system kinase
MKIETVEKILEGDVHAAARLMRGIEDEQPGAFEELGYVYPHTGNAYIIGLTGAPGVGKSTLVDTLIGAFRKKEMTVGVIAVDPTSPFTGGAVLGDRVRMQGHSMDEGVFIRSMATRGWRGGLSKATISMIHVMDAMGKDVILVETVGSGQSEIDITKVADTSILVLSPESGDQVQILKAGILEAADIFVVNKADKDGAANVVSRIEFMIGMRTSYSSEWKPDILLTEAISGKGVEEVAGSILKHKEYLVSTGELEKRRKVRAREELIENVESFVKNYCYQGLEEDSHLEELVDNIAQRKIDPHSAALKIIDWLSTHFKQVATH